MHRVLILVVFGLEQTRQLLPIVPVLLHLIRGRITHLGLLYLNLWRMAYNDLVEHGILKVFESGADLFGVQIDLNVSFVGSNLYPPLVI